MPDGYGDNMDSALLYALDKRTGTDATKLVQEFIANHLRHDHDMPLYEIRQRMGITMKELRELLDNEV